MTEVENFSIYSSDEEFKNSDEIGNRIYEPDPKLIAKLYCEIKEKKILTLDWKSTGRLTPGEYEEENKIDNNEQDSEDKQKDLKDTSDFNDFDFDEDLNDSSLSKMNPLIKKKPTPGPKKVTNLDKVMNDIKKYQKIEKQTKLNLEDDKF